MQKISITDVSIPRLQNFQYYWNARRGNYFAPSWRDIHLDELDPRISPFIVVADVRSDPLDFIIRFWGTEHVARKGVDKTGQSIQEEPCFRGQTAWDEYAWVVENKQPLASKSTVNLNDFDELMPFQQSLVRFPLTDDGVDVHHVISIAAWARSR